jgi:hypothetical protein
MQTICVQKLNSSVFLTQQVYSAGDSGRKHFFSKSKRSKGCDLRPMKAKSHIFAVGSL